MLANRPLERARHMAGAAFIGVAMLTAGCAAPVPVVEVLQDGRVLWDGKSVDRDSLAERIVSGVSRIQLSADANTQYNNVLRVIVAAQKAGVRDITFLPSGTVLETPPPGNPYVLQSVAGAPDPVRLTVDADGSLYWNGTAVDMPRLEQNLKAAATQAAAQNLQCEVQIEANRIALYGLVEQVLASARQACKFVGIIGGPWPDAA